jgi:hypothetical protein
VSISFNKFAIGSSKSRMSGIYAASCRNHEETKNDEGHEIRFVEKQSS